MRVANGSEVALANRASLSGMCCLAGPIVMASEDVLHSYRYFGNSHILRRVQVFLGPESP